MNTIKTPVRRGRHRMLVSSSEVRHLLAGTALELGCGEGADSIWLTKRNWEVTAIDFAPAAIKNLTRIAQKQG